MKKYFKSGMMNMNTKDYLKKIFLAKDGEVMDEEERREALKDYERAVVNYIKADENVANVKRIEKVHHSLDTVVESLNFSDEILKIILDKSKFGEQEKRKIEETCLEPIAKFLDYMVQIFKMRELEALYEQEKKKKYEIREYKRILCKNEQLRKLLEKVRKANYLILDNDLKGTEIVTGTTLDEREIIEQSRNYFNVRKTNNRKIRISLSPYGKNAMKYYKLSQEKRYTEEQLEEEIFSNCMSVVAEIIQEEEHNSYALQMKMNKKYDFALKLAISQARSKMNSRELMVVSVSDISNKPIGYVENTKIFNLIENLEYREKFVEKNNVEEAKNERNKSTRFRRKRKEVLEVF